MSDYKIELTYDPDYDKWSSETRLTAGDDRLIGYVESVDLFDALHESRLAVRRAVKENAS